MTGDHVPPKGCGNDKPMQVRRLLLGVDGKLRADVAKGRRGVEFFTLCAKCNNARVGGNNDEALADLFTSARAARRSGRWQYKATLRPGAILRSILGHMVAVKTKLDGVHTDRDIRRFLVSGKPLSPSIGVYVWHYGRNDIVIARDFTVLDLIHGEASGILSVIKFGPLALCVAKDGPDLFEHTSFHQYATTAVDERIEVTLDFTQSIALDYPELAQRVNPGLAVLMGQSASEDSISARPAPPRR